MNRDNEAERNYVWNAHLFQHGPRNAEDGPPVSRRASSPTQLHPIDLLADGLCAHARVLALYQLDQVLVLDLVRLLPSVRRRLTLLHRRAPV